MRVLLATDGSETADLARDLVAGIAWPAGSVIRVVTAVEGVGALYGMPWAPAVPAGVDRLEQELEQQAQSVLESAARGVARSGATIERQVVRGRAASAIVGEAAEWKADVVVVGSRGHGAIASMLLGSVGAEVVDHAPCPVLIARTRTLTRVVLAHDGSADARAAEELLIRWPIFTNSAIEVVSVAQLNVPWQSGLAPAIYDESNVDYRARTQESLHEHEQIASDSARRLSEAGLHAGGSVVEGSPATELIRVAVDRRADLILLGTHGRSGLERLVLGSVARNVLSHAPMSVLVIRPRERG